MVNMLILLLCLTSIPAIAGRVRGIGLLLPSFFFFFGALTIFFLVSDTLNEYEIKSISNISNI